MSTLAGVARIPIGAAVDTVGRRGVLTASTLGVTTLVLPSGVRAASVVEPSGTPAPTVEADALVQTSAPTTNYGTSSLLLKNYSSLHRIGYVRFGLTDLAWVSAPAPALTLTTVQNNDNVGPYYLPTTFAVEVYGLNEDAAGYAWGESTVTWNTRPAAGSLTGGRYVPSSDATLLGELAVPRNAYPDDCTFTSDALRTFVRGLASPSVTFILIRKDTLNTNLAFAGREWPEGQRPALTLG